MKQNLDRGASGLAAASGKPPTAATARGSADALPNDGATRTRYRTIQVDGVDVFYREAGPSRAPVLLLLHGYPSSSRMFEPLIPLLSDRWRVIAPDYPGFGLSGAPAPSSYPYSFDSLARTLRLFVDALELERYSMYLQDYGGPVGFRLALQQPQRVQALVIQNAVIHEEGLTAIWNLRRDYWRERARFEDSIKQGMYSIQSGIARHVGGRPDLEHYNPDLWMDELAFLRRPGMDAIQLELVYDYQSNVEAYPSWQKYLREQRPPTLLVWGVHDPIFSVDGAHAIRRELDTAQLHLLDAGHFAINDRPREISEAIRAFLPKHVHMSD